MDNSNIIESWTDKVTEDWKRSRTKMNPGLSLPEILSVEPILTKAMTDNHQ